SQSVASVEAGEVPRLAHLGDGPGDPRARSRAVNYWDTSALLKLFVSERGSSDARATLVRGREVATALLTYVEAFSAFTRRGLDGSLTHGDLAKVRRRFGAEWNAYLRVPLTDEVVRRSR